MSLGTDPGLLCHPSRAGFLQSTSQPRVTVLSINMLALVGAAQGIANIEVKIMNMSWTEGTNSMFEGKSSE